MRVGIPALCFALLASTVCAPAMAAEAPSFVIPGRRDVPVIVNPLGFDASYMVVEGDFGLDRPGQVNPVIVGGPLVLPPPFYPGAYFPRDGRRPGYGRLEIEPRRRMPSKPAEGYYRSWSSQSDPIPATLDPPAAYPIDVMVDGRVRGNNGDRNLQDDRRRFNRHHDRRPQRGHHPHHGH